ncbi:MAG: hypothetical protein IJU05_03525 [Schwartzia sp.]|nr:hypothetical protein [Schwartzia sp. (in: firmicutes)]
MKKKAVLVMALFLALANAPGVSADAIDPFGGPRPRRPRPERVVEEPRPPKVEAWLYDEKGEDGEERLELAFTVPGPGTYTYKLYEETMTDVLQTGVGKNERGNATVYHELFAFPQVAEGDEARYILVTDFTLYRKVTTSFGEKRMGEPEDVQVFRTIVIRKGADGPVVELLEPVG